MSCNNTKYVCKCGANFSSYDRLENHIVSHANNGRSGHLYAGRCCDLTQRCLLMNMAL